jgi:hypothetical protein
MITPRPEVQLLLNCTGIEHFPERDSRIRACLHQSLDWDSLITMASWHSVLALLYTKLVAQYSDIVPTEVVAALQTRFHAQAVRNLILARALTEIIKRLSAHGIAALSFKGPALALSAYGHLSMRKSRDLDILVHEKQFLSAGEFLIASGYRLGADYGYEVSLLDKHDQICIDLHCGLTRRPLAVTLDFDRVWSRRSAIKLAGEAVPCLSPEDTLMVLCIQLIKDSWLTYSRLSEISDIARLIHTHPNLNWEQLYGEADRRGCRRIVDLGVSLAQRLIHCEIPVDLSQRLRRESAVLTLTEYLCEKTMHQDQAPSQLPISKKRFRWLVRERWRDKVYPYYHRVFVPNAYDKAVFPVPAWMSFLYYLIRPIRLVAKHSLRVYQPLLTRLIRKL